jgi:hypothetical protein
MTKYQTDKSIRLPAASLAYNGNKSDIKSSALNVRPVSEGDGHVKCCVSGPGAEINLMSL